MTLLVQTSSKWPKVRFGDVVRNVDETVRDPQTCGLERYVGLEHIDPESLHILRWGLIADGTTFTRRFRRGQVLFGKRRAYQRKVAVAEFDGLCSSDILVFEPKDERLLPDLLPFICQTESFFEHALDTSAGSLSPRTKFKELARYEFPLPPLDEQHRIAEILWAADVLKQKYEKLFLELNRFKEIKLDQFFGALSTAWTLSRFEEVITDGTRNGFYKPKEFYGRGIKTIHMGDLFGNEIITSNIDMQRVVLSDDELSRFSVSEGDILFARRSIVKDGAGKCSIISFMDEPISFESSIIKVSPDKEKALPFFIFYWFQSSFGKMCIQSITRGGTGAITGIAGSDLKNIEIPIPPISIQLSLIENMNDINASIFSTSQALKNESVLLRNFREELLLFNDKP